MANFLQLGPRRRVLATCATNRDVLQFSAGEADPVFELNATCGGGGGAFGDPMNRGIPVIVE